MGTGGWAIEGRSKGGSRGKGVEGRLGKETEGGREQGEKGD